MKTLRYLWCLVPAVVLALALPGGGDDKTSAVAIPDRNPVNKTEKSVPTDFEVREEDGQKNVLWKAKIGKTSYGGPTVAAGKVFVGTNNGSPRDPAIKGDRGVVMCFDAKSGKFLWQAVHDKLDAGQAVDFPDQGIASSPTVEGNRVYYVSNRAEVVCADVDGDKDKPGKARIHWTFDMIKELKVFPCQLAVCSPLVVGDLVYVVTCNGWDVYADPPVFPEPTAPSFIAVNKKDGKLAWKSDLPGKNVLDGQWSNPVYAMANGKPQIIFPGGDGWLYGLEPDSGKLIWKFNCNPSTAKFDLKKLRESDRCSFLATPVVSDNKVYVGVGQNPDHGPGVGHLWCIDITKKGDVSPKEDNFDPKAAVNKDSALVWHMGGKRKGQPQGNDREVLFGRTMTTCCVVDGLVYVADLDGFFYCLDAKTGEKYWEHDMKAEVWASPYFVADTVLIG